MVHGALAALLYSIDRHAVRHAKALQALDGGTVLSVGRDLRHAALLARGASAQSIILLTEELMAPRAHFCRAWARRVRTLLWLERVRGCLSETDVAPGAIEWLELRRRRLTLRKNRLALEGDAIGAKAAVLALQNLCEPVRPTPTQRAALAAASAAEAAADAAATARAAWLRAAAAATEEAAVLAAMQATADPLPLRPGEWQNAAARSAPARCEPAWKAPEAPDPDRPLGAPPAPTIEGVLLLAKQRRSARPDVAPYAFNRERAASVTDRLLAGESLEVLLLEASASARCRPDPEVTANALRTYDRVLRLERVLRGIEIPTDASLERVLYRPVPKGYRGAPDVVNGALATAQRDGVALLFDARAAEVLRAAGFNGNPLSVVYALGKKPRMVHNCSAGSYRGGLHGSANGATTPEAIEATYGAAHTHSISDVAATLNAWVTEDPKCVPEGAMSDVRGAFTRLRFTLAQSLVLGAGVYDPRAPPETEEIAFALFARGSFGYAGLPAAFYVVGHAAQHVVQTCGAAHPKGHQWYEVGFCNFECPPPIPTMLQPWCFFFVDDFLALDKVNADAKLASVNRALELLLAPRQSRHFEPRPALPEQPYSEIAAADKQVSSGTLFTFTGWDCCTRSRVFALGFKGWLKLVEICFDTLARAACTGVELESALGALTHYDKCHVLMKCFTMIWRHLLCKYGRAHRQIPLRSASLDLKVWQQALRSAVRDPSIVTFSWSSLLEQPQHSAALATDASGTGGGGMRGTQAAVRWSWTEEELEASKGEASSSSARYFINVLELYAFVAALTLWAHELSGHVVLCHVDNQVAIVWARKWKSRSAPARMLLQWAALVCYRHKITLDLEYITSEDNTGPDLLSRPETTENLQAYADHLPPGTPHAARYPQVLPEPLRAQMTRLLRGEADADLMSQVEHLTL